MEDLWGYMLEDYYNKYGDRSGMQVDKNHFFYAERDDGYIIKQTIYRFITREFNEWSFAERAALKKAYGRVLDGGCGSGRMSLYLQEQGLEVKAIDISQRCVDLSRRRGVIDVELQDLYSMNYPKDYFDTILIMGTGGLIPNTSHINRLVNKIKNIIKPTGQVICSSCYWLPDPTHEEYKNTHGVLVNGRIKYLDLMGDWETSLQFNIEEFESILPRDWEITDIFEAGSENLPYVQWSCIVKRK